jgi:hypothetical protein
MTAIAPPPKPNRKTSTAELFAEIIARQAHEVAELGHALALVKLKLGAYEAELDKLRARVAVAEGSTLTVVGEA